MASRGRARGTKPVGEAPNRGARSTAPGSPARPPRPETYSRFGVALEEAEEKVGQFDDATEQEGVREASRPAESSTALQTSTTEGATKLNPAAPVFSPTSPKGPLSSSNSTLNPNTPRFSPTTELSSNSTNPSHTHTQSPHTIAVQLKLNPQSMEFVPKTMSRTYAGSSVNSSLNASAPEFVPNEDLPRGMQNGQLSDSSEEPVSIAPNDDSFIEEESPSLKPNDIISGVKYPFDQTSDVASESVLKAAADLLIKFTIYPGSFERGRTKLENTVKSWTPTDETLANLAEMLIHWGIMEPSLSLSSSRICQVFSDMEVLKGVFTRQMVVRLRHWFQERTTIERGKLLNFSLFFAEIFSRLKTSNRETPIYQLGLAVQTLITELLQGDEKSVIGACHILKLTGPLLAAVKKEGDSEIDKIISTLERLSTDETLPLSEKCVEIIVRVLELHAHQWGVRPLTSATAPSMLNEYMFGSGDHAVSEEEGTGFLAPTEVDTFHQSPVSNPEEWNEFLDDDNQPIEDSDVSQGFVVASEGGQEEELDEEMQKEFEFFVQDLEEHLLNVGEMDPELFQEEQ